MTSPPYYFIVKKIDGKYVDRFTNPIHAISAAYDDAMWDGHKPDWYYRFYTMKANKRNYWLFVCHSGKQKFITDYIFPDGFICIDASGGVFVTIEHLSLSMINTHILSIYS